MRGKPLRFRTNLGPSSRVRCGKRRRCLFGGYLGPAKRSRHVRVICRSSENGTQKITIISNEITYIVVGKPECLRKSYARKFWQMRSQWNRVSASIKLQVPAIKPRQLISTGNSVIDDFVRQFCEYKDWKQRLEDATDLVQVDAVRGTKACTRFHSVAKQRGSRLKFHAN